MVDCILCLCFCLLVLGRRQFALFHDQQTVLPEKLFVQRFYVCNTTNECVLTLLQPELSGSDLLFEVNRNWRIRKSDLVENLQRRCHSLLQGCIIFSLRLHGASVSLISNLILISSRYSNTICPISSPEHRNEIFSVRARILAFIHFLHLVASFKTRSQIFLRFWR